MKLSNTYRHHIFANHASTANFFFSGTLQYQLSLPKVRTLEFFSKVVLEEQGFLEIQRYHKKGPPHILPTYITLAWDINIESLTKKRRFVAYSSEKERSATKALLTQLS